MPIVFEKTFSDRSYAPTWLFGAETYAIDRFVPDVEHIFNPAYVRPGGTLTVMVSEKPEQLSGTVPHPRRNRLLAKMSRKPTIIVIDEVVFDTRSENYFNWSHHVNKFLLHALLARSCVKRRLTVVLPASSPPVLVELYRIFGFDVLASDAPLECMTVSVRQSHVDLMETARHFFLTEFNGEIAATLSGLSGGRAFGKVFLARKNSRAVSNVREIEPILQSRGFETIYPEMLSANDQLRLWNEATHIVSIHGAGMAPLQFRQPGDYPLKLVEICPIGHMTRFFGTMCQDVRGQYVAVRGRIKPVYVDNLFCNDRPFLRWSEDCFEVGPRSLSLALDQVEQQDLWGTTFAASAPR